ncbi:GNAT family N-acetyltransferase [Sporomusa acidovorans]|uniref:N-acetyltransferase domain-containing protein n=1 Tax=Sporomusa acidovorans (strain ATCC 49682 / DSM 3132 / Mol) TaxID=1123286 RepID=A0ABZ3J1L6_SPOA4|nr:GNAT family N-acetyltransferase [Sporomusa acidovorans]OZC22847.1 acetyltransferase (GNAT) family protein [Sporomusa acidovorans DSM 3132]SDE52884.1 Ribosomal protein S18 acetylase RimI [Sporomusa acidovorans]
MTEKPFDSVKIEAVRRSDLEQLEDLFITAFAKEYDIQQIKRRIHRARQFYYLLYPLSRFSLWVRNHFHVYGVKVAGQLAGFVQISYPNSTQLHIDYIAFAEQYRGKGLGSWVLTKLLNNVNHLDVILEVLSDSPAYYFYKRLGFKQITEILHYGLSLTEAYHVLPAPPDGLAGFRKLEKKDREQLYLLHKNSVPHHLRQIMGINYGDFNRGMLIRKLDWAKNYLMRKQKMEYVVERQGKIVALLTINSYLKANNHVLTLMIHRDYEYLRAALISKAVGLIRKKHRRGMISMTIYSDHPAKQETMEHVGFRKDSAYSLMIRPSPARHKESIRGMPRQARERQSVIRKH